MNENLFASFITPTIIGFPSSKRLINNRLHSFQH
uniref:Uncharacterized protein n=1 Tax=Mus musculus TaxID=10090 RepID=Q6NSS0_MOUSE|nr:Unknown (protein for MGC:78219) [Mus musculus]